jgi:hypothetical protein
MIRVIFAQMGGSDCERLGTGAFAQPVNTVSSLAYTLVGVSIVGWAFAVSGKERTLRVVFGVLLASTGIGSVFFHGPQFGGSQFAHDASFLVTLWFLGSMNLADAYSWASRRRWSVLVVGSIVVFAALGAVPSITNVVMVLGVIILVASDVLGRHRGRESSAWFVASIVAIALAVVVFVLGRTGSPLCDPDSLIQGHALWHVLGAVGLGSYFVATSRARQLVIGEE